MYLSGSIARFLRGVKLLLFRSRVREKAVRISPGSARKPIPISARPFRGPIPIVRKQRLRRRMCRFIDGHSRIIGKGNYSGCSERVRKPGIQAWDPLFRRVYPLPPGLEWYTPCSGSVAPAGRASPCVSEPTAGPSECDGTETRYTRTGAPGAATERGGCVPTNVGPTSWHGSCYAYARPTKEGGPSGPECDKVHTFSTPLRPVYLTRLWACATL